MLKIKMYPARDGDAFLVTHERKKRTNVLIDAGYAATFDSFIFGDLSDIGYLDLVVATHIDADHISGLLRLLNENKATKNNEPVEIRNFWHNSLRCFSYDGTLDQLSQGDRELLKEILDRGYQPASASLDSEISARHGSSLAGLLVDGGYVWNCNQGENAILASSSIELNSEIKVTAIGPNEDRLFKLRDWWLREIRRLGIASRPRQDSLFQDAFEFVCSFEEDNSITQLEELSSPSETSSSLEQIYAPDNSATNGSSISLVLTAGKCKVLFLGDSIAEDIVDWFESIEGANSHIVFDAIKISHHGSFRNTSPRLLELIDAKKFFVSTNGDKHNHPDRQVLEAIVDRPAAFERELLFNYSTSASRALKNYRSKSGASFRVIENATDYVSITNGCA